jgi:DNA-directed RNA polymerase III subunit RPC8
MFVLTTIVDTIRIPPYLLAQPTLTSVHHEMDLKFPNRVIMDVGLVICRYGNAQVGDGVCVAGDGGAHHEVLAKLLVFRPFCNEICVGTVQSSTSEGLQVSLGFFDNIFIPAYWMLRPSHYETETGLWVWTPTYDEDDEEENRFEMDIGVEIRFRVKSINFTRVINTAKGVQATTTTTSQQSMQPTMERSLSVGSADGASLPDRPVRKRSTSVDLSESSQIPASMHIVASICEDGLGLTSWWTSGDDDDDDAEEEEVEEGEAER